MFTKKLIKSFFILFVLFLLSAQQAFAQPRITEITGNLTHGSTITISGSSFGLHPDYSPDQNFLNKAWHNFENGSLAGGGVHLSDSAGNWSVDSLINRANSGYSAKKRYNNYRGGHIGVWQTDTPTKWYTSFWIRFSSLAAQGKFFRIWGSLAPGENNNNIWLATGGTDFYVRGARESRWTINEGGLGETVWSSPNTFSAGVWHRIETYMTENPNEFTVWIDGKFQWTKSWVQVPFLGNGHTWDLGGMIEPGDGTYHFDDVFFNHTRARIEIGNAATWSASTHREIQIPISWSNNSITITVNKGSFANLNNAYLYVVNEDGRNENGYPLCPSCPKPPTNLTIR